jgi:hypothetical protein
MKKQLLILLAISSIIAGCSTSATVQSSGNLKGKRIGIGAINISFDKMPKKFIPNDSTYYGMSESVKALFIPYLQQAGFNVVDLKVNHKANMAEATRVADSLKIDYVFSGAGLVQVTGKSFFMHKLNVRLTNTNTNEIPMTGSFSGAGVFFEGAVERIGKEMVKKMN